VRGKGGRIGPELGPDRDLPDTPAQFAAVLWNVCVRGTTGLTKAAA